MFSFFFFNDTATTEIYTLSLHDALPISATAPETRGGCPPPPRRAQSRLSCPRAPWRSPPQSRRRAPGTRSEEHTSELQSQSNLVCRLLLEKKKKQQSQQTEDST